MARRQDEPVAIAQRGASGSNFRNCDHNTVATSAIPIGMPGCPELAAWTASIASARMAFAMGVKAGVTLDEPENSRVIPMGGNLMWRAAKRAWD